MCKNSIVLIVTVVALCAGLLAFIRCSDVSKDDDTKSDWIADVKTKDIVSLKISNEDGDALDIRKTEKHWEISDTGESLNDIAVESALTLLCYVTPEKMIENPENLSAFGLNKPERVIVLITDGNEEIRYFIGSGTVDNSGIYFSLAGDDNVYIVDKEAIVRMFRSLDAITEDLSVDIPKMDDVTELITPLKNGSMGRFAKRDGGINPDGSDWIMESPVRSPVYTKMFENVLMSLLGFRLKSRVSNDILPEHGLDEQSGKVIHISAKNNRRMTIKLGTKADENTYYCTVSEKDGVYLTYRNTFQYLEYETPFTLLQPSILGVNADEIAEIEWRMDGVVHKLRNDGDEYFIDGINAHKGNYEALMKRICLMFVSYIPEKDTQETIEIGNMKVLLNNGEDYSIKFYTYGIGAYAISYFDEPSAIVKRDIVDREFSLLEQGG